jgi:hypothetical protein
MANGAAAAVDEDDGVSSITELDCSVHANLRDARLVEKHRLGERGERSPVDGTRPPAKV